MCYPATHTQTHHTYTYSLPSRLKSRLSLTKGPVALTGSLPIPFLACCFVQAQIWFSMWCLSVIFTSYCVGVCVCVNIKVYLSVGVIAHVHIWTFIVLCACLHACLCSPTQSRPLFTPSWGARHKPLTLWLGLCPSSCYFNNCLFEEEKEKMAGERKELDETGWQPLPFHFLNNLSGVVSSKSRWTLGGTSTVMSIYLHFQLADICLN